MHEQLHSPEVGEVLDSTSNLAEPLVQNESFVSKIWRYWRRLSLIGVVSVGAGLYGASHDPVEVQFGPHRAEAVLNIGGSITIDGGLIGAARLSSGLPVVGADISVKEIPTTDSSTKNLPKFTELQGELSPQQLEQFGVLYASVSESGENIQSALQQQFLKYTALGAIATSSLYALIGKKQLEKIGHRGLLIPTLVASTLLLPGETSPKITSDWISTGETFAGTPFDGLEIKGEILRLAVPAIKQLVDYFEENEEFYDATKEGVTELAANKPLLPEDETAIKFVFVTDQHCNVGMNRVIQQVAQEIDAELLLNGGDATFSGTEFEKYCLDELAISGQNVIALGNHDDNVLTRKQFEQAGFTVLDGSIAQVGDLTILGDTHPQRSEFGSRAYYWSSETISEQAERMKQVACEAEIKPDILLVHDPKVGRPALEAGCANLVLAGHTHKITEEIILNETGEDSLLITGGTSGGSDEGRPTIGPLKNTATITIGQLDSTTGKMLRYRFINFNPDNSIDLGDLRTVDED